MALFIFIIFQLLLQVKSQGLPQATLTIFPTFATHGEKVQMLCGGHENHRVSECMFYPAGQENFKKPSALCNITLTSIELIMWSQDSDSSHVNISCYYTVYSSGENATSTQNTSPHSNKVSVRVRGFADMSSLSPITEDSPTTLIPNETSEANLSTASTTDTACLAAMSSLSPITEDSPTTLIPNETSEGLAAVSSSSPITEDSPTTLIPIETSEGLAAMSSSSPITEDSPTTLIHNETSEAKLSTASTTDTASLAVTSSTEITTDPITNMSSLTTHDSSLTSGPANASMESSTLAETTEPASGLGIKKYSNKKVFFSIAVAATGGGIVLTGVMGICLYGCTRRPKDERIWIEKKSKKKGAFSPIVSLDLPGEEDTAFYSTINSVQSTSQPPGNSEESKQTVVELNHLYATILTQPSIASDNNEVYSLLTVL